MEDWRKGKKTVGDKLDYFSKIKGDVTFSVGDPDQGQVEEIRASVINLCALSPVFETMFDDRWKGQEEVIPLPDIQPKIFRHFLNVIRIRDCLVFYVLHFKLTGQELLGMGVNCSNFVASNG